MLYYTTSKQNTDEALVNASEQEREWCLEASKINRKMSVDLGKSCRYVTI